MDEDLKPLFNKLTRLQKGVCLGVLEGKSQRQAYFAAGGAAKNDESADSITARMLTDAKVKAFMEAAEGKAVTSAIMSKEEMLNRLSTIARGNVSDLVEFGTAEIQDADGNPIKQSYWHLKDQDNLSDEQLSLIAELTAGKDGFKFKTHSPTAAAKELAALMGYNAPQKIAQTDTKGDDLSPTELGRRILYAIQLESQNVTKEPATANSNKQAGEDNE